MRIMKKKIEAKTVVRTAALAAALFYQALVISGKSPLPFTEEEMEQAVSMAITAAASIWAWWKNNSFTQAAIRADELRRKPWQ